MNFLLAMETCVFCGREVSNVDSVTPNIRDTFTAYHILSHGEHACRRCNTMYEDSKYRRSNWWVKYGGYHRLETEERLSFLDRPPSPPFLLYFTRNYRKHGWILSVQNPVLDTDNFYLVIDQDKVWFEREKYEELRSFSKELLDQGIPKKWVKGGCPPPSVLRKYKLKIETVRRLKKLKGNRLWEVCVDFYR